MFMLAFHTSNVGVVDGKVRRLPQPDVAFSAEAGILIQRARISWKTEFLGALVFILYRAAHLVDKQTQRKYLHTGTDT
jgi:hypothetical protein